MPSDLDSSNDKALTGMRRMFENEYASMNSDVTLLRNEINDLKYQVTKLEEENRKLRKDLKESVKSQFDALDTNLSITHLQETGSHSISLYNENESVRNLEKQIMLIKEERDNAMQMWQQALNQITHLEKDQEILKLQINPNNVSYQLQLQQAQDEFNRAQLGHGEEMRLFKEEINKKNDEINSLNMQTNELKILIENLRMQLNEKDHEKREAVKREFGYDEAVISLQNIINELETKNQAILKDSENAKEKRREIEMKLNDMIRQKDEAELKVAQLKVQLEEHVQEVLQARLEKHRFQVIEQKQREDHERLHNAIGELMKEATNKTKQEVDSLKRIYNTNIEKLISEYTLLENEKNEKTMQLEKALRGKKSVEQELEKLTNETLRASNRDNSAYEDLHRRFCQCEREKDDAINKLDNKESELKKLQKLYETEKLKLQEIISDMRDKSQKLIFDLEKLSEEHSRTINDLDDAKKKINDLQNDKEQLQKKYTKQIQISENQLQNKDTEYHTKLKSIEDNHNHAMFELRQLLNMQQRMSNKWKEECHAITTQSEQKLLEFRTAIDNLRTYNEKLLAELQDAKRKEVESEKLLSTYSLKMKALENRVKDAETQATEATKRIAKQVARDRLMLYEKHLLENDLEKNKFGDTFTKGRGFFRDIDETPTRNLLEEAL